MTFLDHMRACRAPFVLRRRAPAPELGDARVHTVELARDPSAYALAALAPGVPVAQRMRVLFLLLASSRARVPAADRATLDRVVRALLVSLPADDVLCVFLAVRRVRGNHAHTRRQIAAWVLAHPELGGLVRRRRASVREALEHAVGVRTLRGAVRRLAAHDVDLDDRALRRALWRYAPGADRGRAAAALVHLYDAGVRAPAARGDYRAVHAGHAVADEAAARPKTVTATNRGDVAATLVHLYRGGATDELTAAVARFADEAAATMPRLDGHVALVLDASASTRGLGDREFACVSQSVALAEVLRRCVTTLSVVVSGGRDWPPRPEGDSDLAGATLEALALEPDVVAVVSDGYENRIEGDLARLAASLAGAGVDTPLVAVLSKFTWKDDLSLRHLGVAEVGMWHQHDFSDVLMQIAARARGGRGDAFLRAALAARLDRYEKEVPSWYPSL